MVLAWALCFLASGLDAHALLFCDSALGLSRSQLQRDAILACLVTWYSVPFWLMAVPRRLDAVVCGVAEPGHPTVARVRTVSTPVLDTLLRALRQIRPRDSLYCFSSFNLV